MQRAKQLVASFLTMGAVTIAGVLFFFRPIVESDAPSAAWPAPFALAVYAGLSIALMDWAAKRLGSAFSAAFVVAASQAILIVDLLARGERGYLTALAGIALVAVTWIGVAFVYSKLSDE